ncbi:MAG: hypothetical protein PHW52_03700 [Candidatus Pacebacteria bacterium]|nr:hypothetical protein [Candidatus Paceibacterota bacterium]
MVIDVYNSKNFGRMIMKSECLMRYIFTGSVPSVNLRLKTRFSFMDFNRIQELYINSKKGSMEEEVALQCLLEKMLTFGQFKIVYYYVSGNDEFRYLLLSEMFRRARCFDDWCHLYMISDRDQEEKCLIKMNFYAKDFYELRCVYANSKNFDYIRRNIVMRISKLVFTDDELFSRAIDSCAGYPEIRSILLDFKNL